MNMNYKKHPSYGRIVLGKPSSSLPGYTLFGSKVKHTHFISMEIEGASIAEDGFSEFIGGGKNILRLHLSEAQWAHMVSSFGDGSGTPCTIVWTEKDGWVEKCPDSVPVLDLAKETATKTKQDLVVRLKNLEQDVKSLSETAGTVKKKDLTKLAMDFNVLASWLHSNFDFLENQVKERMEKEVAKANIEIEALISNAVTRLGERALRTQIESGETVDLPKMLTGEQNV